MRGVTAIIVLMVGGMLFGRYGINAPFILGAAGGSQDAGVGMGQFVFIWQLGAILGPIGAGALIQNTASQHVLFAYIALFMALASLTLWRVTVTGPQMAQAQQLAAPN